MHVILVDQRIFFGKVSDLKGMRTGIISFNLYMVFKNYLSKCNHIKIIDINFQIEGYLSSHFNRKI